MKEDKLNIKRETAYKININDILKAKYEKQEGWNPNYIIINNKKINRINLLGIIISKIKDEITNSDNLLIDDGTGEIMIRSFENNIENNMNIGDLILIIGKPREFNNNRYIVPEIIKKIDKKWLLIRKEELKNKLEDKEEITEIKEKVIENGINDENDNLIKKIIKTIKNFDNGSGVDINELINIIENKETENIIKNLLLEGEIFEVKPGFVKILE